MFYGVNIGLRHMLLVANKRSITKIFLINKGGIIPKMPKSTLCIPC